MSFSFVSMTCYYVIDHSNCTRPCKGFSSHYKFHYDNELKDTQELQHFYLNIGSGRILVRKKIGCAKLNEQPEMLFYFITVHQRSWGKVMFSQACVKNSVHRGICLRACWDTHPLCRHPPLGRHPP